MWILWSAAGGCYCIRRQHVLRFLQEAKLEALAKDRVIIGAKACNMSENLETTGKSLRRSILRFLCHLYFHVSVMFAQFKKNKTGRTENTLVFASNHILLFRVPQEFVVWTNFHALFSCFFLYICIFLGLLGDIVLEDVFYCQHSACFASRFLQ